MLCQHLRRAAANVSLHTTSILLGVGGTIYRPYSLEPLERLGLDPQKATKLDVKLHEVHEVHAHSAKYTYKLVSTRCALEKIFATA